VKIFKWTSLAGLVLFFVIGCASFRSDTQDKASLAMKPNTPIGTPIKAVSAPVEKKKPKKKRDAIDSLLQVDGEPSIDVAHESFLRGLDLRRAEQLPVAELFYKRALANSPGNRFLAFELASILYDQEKYGEGLKIARTAVEFQGDPNSSEFLLLGNLFRENGELDRARMCYRKAVEANDQNLHALYEYSRLLEAMQDYEELARVFEMLLPLLDYQPPMIERLLLLYKFNQNDTSMVNLLRTAYKVHGDPAYACKLADALEGMGRSQEALQTIVSALDKAPEDRDAWNTLVRLQLRAGQLEEARISQTRLYNLDTTQTDVLERLAMLEYDVGRLDSAERHFQILVQKDSTLHVGHFFLSHLAQLAGDSSRALAHIRIAIALRPDALPYRNQLGAIYYLSGGYTQAHAVFDSTLAISPLPLTMQLKGAAYAHEADRVTDKERSNVLRRSSLDWRLKSYALDSTGLDVVFDIAATYERLAMPDSAMVWFERLLRRAPRHAAALNYLGYLLVDSKRDVPRGIRLVDSALTLDPGNPAYLDSRGWGLYREGRYSEALDIFDKLEASGMDDVALWEHLAFVCEALGLQDRALVYWNRVLRKDPGHSKAKTRIGATP